jgi:tellurite resistance protein TehA-like permease
MVFIFFTLSTLTWTSISMKKLTHMDRHQCDEWHKNVHMSFMTTFIHNCNVHNEGLVMLCNSACSIMCIVKHYKWDVDIENLCA